MIANNIVKSHYYVIWYSMLKLHFINHCHIFVSLNIFIFGNLQQTLMINQKKNHYGWHLITYFPHFLFLWFALIIQ